jgi:formylglycine-generating enzyme required for sulfatase activity
MKIPNIFYLLICAIFFAVSSCSQEKKAADQSLTSKGATPVTLADISFNGDTSSLGMVKIPAGTYMMGGDNQQASEDEYPKLKISDEDAVLDIPEVKEEVVDPMTELENKVSETLVLNL